MGRFEDRRFIPVPEFTKNIGQQLRRRFRSLDADTQFPLWEQWVRADWNGTEDDFISELCCKMTSQLPDIGICQIDLVMMLFPYAGTSEFATIRSLRPVKNECALKVKAPPILEKSEYEELCSLFEE